MLNRRNHTFQQLGHTFRERSADVVHSPLPAEMQALVLKLASVDPPRSRDCIIRRLRASEIHCRTMSPP